MNGDAGIERWEIKGSDWKSRICPRKLISGEAHAWLQLYSLFKAGHLLNAGGVIDQPAIYLHAMTTIESFVAGAK